MILKITKIIKVILKITKIIKVILKITKIIKVIFKKYDGGTDWIQLTQDRDRRRELVNAVMNRRVV